MRDFIQLMEDKPAAFIAIGFFIVVVLKVVFKDKDNAT